MIVIELHKVCRPKYRYQVFLVYMTIQRECIALRANVALCNGNTYSETCGIGRCYMRFKNRHVFVPVVIFKNTRLVHISIAFLCPAPPTLLPPLHRREHQPKCPRKSYFRSGIQLYGRRPTECSSCCRSGGIGEAERGDIDGDDYDSV